MSLDMIIVVPSDYTIHTLLDRIPKSMQIQDLKDGRYCIPINERGVWLEKWNYVREFYSTPNEAFDNDQNLQLSELKNPQYFIITGGNTTLLYPIIEHIGDDPHILIDGGNVGNPLRRGDEFVRMIRNGENP